MANNQIEPEFKLDVDRAIEYMSNTPPKVIQIGEGVHREESEPFIQWKHVDGPAIVTSNGSMNWLSVWDRVLLFFGFTSLELLNDKYKYKK